MCRGAGRETALKGTVLRSYGPQAAAGLHGGLRPRIHSPKDFVRFQFVSSISLKVIYDVIAHLNLAYSTLTVNI